jgi:hypothetical protein
MTAAEERRALAALGRDLLAAAGPPGVRRGAALVADAPPLPAAGFAELGAAPDWLRAPCTELTALAERTALVSMAQALAGCIDGQRLGRLAEICGEAAIDAAIADAQRGDDRAIADADDLASRGFAILAAAVSPSLRAYLPPCAVADVDAGRAAAWVERARRLP